VLQGSSEDKGQTVEQQFTQTMAEIHSVVPGVFGLFGFQLIAAFNDTFGKELSSVDNGFYLVALVLLGCSAALLMTPASYHRQVRPHSVSDAFGNLMSRLLTWAMLPLAAVFPIDAYLVAKVVSKNTPGSAALGAALFLVFAGAWFVFPRSARRRNEQRRTEMRERGREPGPA
jgi:hypothetical protein